MTSKHVQPKTDACKAGSPESLLACVTVAAKAMGIAAEETKLAQAWTAINTDGREKDLLAFIRKEVQLKAEIINAAPETITQRQPRPAIARMQDGSYVVLGKCRDNQVVLFDPQEGKSKAVPAAEFLPAWSGQLIVLSHAWGIAGLIRRLNLTWFWPAIAKYKRFLGEVAVGSFFLQLFGLITPLFTQVIIDKVIIHRGVATLDILAIVLLIAAIFQTGMSILRTYLLTHTTNKLDVIFGARLFRHIAALPLRYFEQRRVGDTLTRVTAMNSIREFLTGSAITAAMDTLFAVIFIAVMFYYNVSLTLLALAVLPIYLLQNIWATPVYKERLQAVWAAGAASNAFLVETITGIHTVKALAVEPQFNHRWEQLLARHVGTAFSSATMNIFVSNTGGLIQLLSGFSILWLGGHMVMDGKMTIGQLIAFQMLAGQASAPLFRLVGMWQSLQQTMLSLERVGDILLTSPESGGQAQKLTQPQPLQGAVHFEQVSFRYHIEGPDVLKEFSLAIPPGAKVGLVGRSGSGKSTLAKLVQRLYLPASGRILLDGHDSTQLDPSWLRRQIGVVPQESFLFSGSIRDNIAIACPSAAMEEIIRVSQIAGAHDFILELPEGYDTQAGERGSLLSGGQRQRIAIARALLANPRILIFDEATSALDYQSERIIRRNLNQMAEGRTLLMIAHRLSTVRHCDIIIVLDNGKILEQGSHQELLANKGLYYQLYQMQNEV